MKVAVRNLAVFAKIGINPGEIGRCQPLVVAVILSLARILADEIGATIDYCEIVRAAEALLCDPRVRTAAVAVSKPEGLDRGIASAQISLRQASHPRDSSLLDGTGR